MDKIICAECGNDCPEADQFTYPGADPELSFCCEGCAEAYEHRQKHPWSIGGSGHDTIIRYSGNEITRSDSDIFGTVAPCLVDLLNAQEEELSDLKEELSDLNNLRRRYNV